MFWRSGLTTAETDRRLHLDPVSGVLRAVGEITMASADRWVRLFAQTLSELPAAGSRTTVSVDLAGVVRCDSAVLAVIAQWDVMAHAQGVTLTTCNAPAHLRAITRLCGAGDVWGLDRR